MPTLRVCALLMVLLFGLIRGEPSVSGNETGHAHEEQSHIELAWADVHWTGLAGAIGNGPDDPEGVAPAVTAVVNQEADLQTGPGTAYDTITRLAQGDGVRVQLRHDGWLKVAAVDGTEGWLGANHVTFTKGSAQDVPVASYIPPVPESPPPDEPITEAPEVEEPPAEPTAEAPPAEQAPEEEAPIEEPTADEPTEPNILEEEHVSDVTETPVEESQPPAAGKRPAPAPAKPQTPAPAPAKPPSSVPGANKPASSPAPAQPVISKPVASAPPARPRWVWPTRGTITSGFGYRDLNGRQFHNGIDIANDKWTPILAAYTGAVTEAGWCSGLGYCVKIRHAGGLVSEYGHMARKPLVRAGQEVQAGAHIGHMGSTYDRRGGGYSTGVHLHFTLRLNGRAVNPRAYLP